MFAGFRTGLLSRILLCGFVPVLSLQEESPRPDWKAAAQQNQYLQEYFSEEYWRGRREEDPQAIRTLSSREPSERQYPTNEVPQLERIGRSRAARPEGRPEQAEKSVAEAIRKLVHKTDKHLVAVRESFEAVKLVADDSRQKEKRKQLRKSLKKVAKQAEDLHTLLQPVYTTLKARDESFVKPGKDSENLDLTSELLHLDGLVKLLREQVQDTLAGSPVVRAAEYSQNMLLTLDQVQKAAEGLSEAL